MHIKNEFFHGSARRRAERTSLVRSDVRNLVGGEPGLPCCVKCLILFSEVSVNKSLFDQIFSLISSRHFFISSCLRSSFSSLFPSFRFIPGRCGRSGQVFSVYWPQLIHNAAAGLLGRTPQCPAHGAFWRLQHYGLMSECTQVVCLVCMLSDIDLCGTSACVRTYVCV